MTVHNVTRTPVYNLCGNYEFQILRELITGFLDLQAENAALRERLDKATELPCRLRNKLYFVNEYLETPKIEEHIVTAFTILPYCIKVHVQNGGYFLPDNENVCFNREAAKARLKELQGEKK